MKQSSRKAKQKHCTAKLPASVLLSRRKKMLSRAENTRDFSVVEIREKKRDRFVLEFGKL
jgi:hypothetical protein